MKKDKFEYKAGEHLFICGMTRTGKSYALKKLIVNILKENYIIFDLKREDFESLGCTKVKNYKEFIFVLSKGEKKILVQDDEIDINTIERYFSFLYRNCKNFTVVVDELHLLVTKHLIPPSLKKILHIGASQKKAFWGASQRTADIHNSILSQSLHILAFHMGIETDRKKINEEMNLKEHNLEFSNLEKFHFFYLKKVHPIEPRITKV